MAARAPTPKKPKKETLEVDNNYMILYTDFKDGIFPINQHKVLISVSKNNSYKNILNISILMYSILENQDVPHLRLKKNNVLRRINDKDLTETDWQQTKAFIQTLNQGQPLIVHVVVNQLHLPNYVGKKVIKRFSSF